MCIRDSRFVVCTGGEPLLQLDKELVEAFHDRNFRIAIETNGTRQPPANIDWICMSPKAGAQLVLRRGNELKLVFPQPSLSPAEAVSYTHLDVYKRQIEHRVVVIPRSSNPKRIEENFDLWGWSLTTDEVALLDGLSPGPA